MYQIFAVLIVIASILLVGVILIQKSKGGGLAANVNNYNQFMGVRKTTDFVEKATWLLAGFICVLSIASAFVDSPNIVEGGVPQIKKLPTAETQAPAFGTQGDEAATPAASAPAESKVTVPAKDGAPAVSTTEQDGKTTTKAVTTAPGVVDEAPAQKDKKK